MNTFRALTLTERRNQDEQWGGPGHDDKHLDTDWLFFIERQIALMTETSGALRYVTSPEAFQSRLVKIAALAEAAWESAERKRLAVAQAVAQPQPPEK